MCYSCRSCEVANICTGHVVCWLHCLSLFCWAWEHVSTSNSSVLCPGSDGLAVLRELSCGDGEGIHLPPLARGWSGWFYYEIPEVLVHSHELFNTDSSPCRIAYSLCNLVSPWCQRRQLLGQERLKCVWTKQIPGWQGVWKDLGRILEWLSCPTAWDLKPEHEGDPELNWCATWQNSALPTPVKTSFHQCPGAWPVPTEPQFSTLRGLWLSQTHKHYSHHSSSKKETVDKENNRSISSVSKGGGRRGKVWSRRWPFSKEIRGRGERIQAGSRKYLVTDHRISRHVEDVCLLEQLKAPLPGNCLGITSW